MSRSSSRASRVLARIVAASALGWSAFAGPAEARQVPGDPIEAGVQVLARGPIHEAFAEPFVSNPGPGVVVPKPPPSTQIEEVPPSEKPVGHDVEWIPGYWAWDDERGDYIWISGIWRDIPPGRQWVPGYWSQAGGGFAWTSGFWAPTSSNGQYNYLPPPPPSLENGPNAPQPGPDFSWLPGSWVWIQDRYAWRPGYWVQANPDWIWMPSRYVATPGGYVYLEGYWDYNLQRRGLAFAPVAFGPAAYGQPYYAYSPSYVLPVSGLVASLFIRPTYGHYYFGDYYGLAAQGPRSGYVPWFSYRESRVVYDPIYASMSTLNRGNPEWDRRIREDYRARVEDPRLRPAPTFEAQRALAGNPGIVQPLKQWASSPEAYHRLAPVEDRHRAELARRQVEVQQVRQERARMEEQARVPANLRPEEHRPQRLELPRSPVVAGGGVHPEGFRAAAPPPHPEAHREFRPTFEREPALVRRNPNVEHREPNRRPEGPPHREPRAPREGGEHPRPGQPR